MRQAKARFLDGFHNWKNAVFVTNNMGYRDLIALNVSTRPAARIANFMKQKFMLHAFLFSYPHSNSSPALDSALIYNTAL
jgi:hypothetical protein